MRQKCHVPIRPLGTNPTNPKKSERLKPFLKLGFRGFVPMFRVFRTVLKGQGLKNRKTTIHRHLSSRLGVGLKGNLRRIKIPANRLAGRAPTLAAPACRMATAAGVMIYRQPMGRGILSASCPPMVGRAARHGHFIRLGKVPICSPPLVLAWVGRASAGRDSAATGWGGTKVQRTPPGGPYGSRNFYVRRFSGFFILVGSGAKTAIFCPFRSIFSSFPRF